MLMGSLLRDGLSPRSSTRPKLGYTVYLRNRVSPRHEWQRRNSVDLRTYWSGPSSHPLTIRKVQSRQMQKCHHRPKIWRQMEAAMQVLLSGMSNMLVSIITSALSNTPITIIPERSDRPEDLASQIRSTQADAVIMQDDRAGHEESVVHLLRSFPSLKVVTISRDGHSGTFQELRLFTLAIEELSTDTLRNVLLGDTTSAPF